MSKGRNFLSAWLGLKKPSIPDKSFTSALYQLMRVDASMVVQFGKFLDEKETDQNISGEATRTRSWSIPESTNYDRLSLIALLETRPI